MKSKFQDLTTISFLLLLTPITPDFIYPDFNQTLGLVFNGATTVTECLHPTPSKTAPPYIVKGERNGGLQSSFSTETHDNDKDKDKIRKEMAQFGHRDNFVVGITTGCAFRLRLTPSLASQRGSVWYEKRLPVLTGFDTTFTFQISSHSQTCSEHVDPSFSLPHHKSCAVHGGDGFAFLLHNDPNATAALGGNGLDLGYGGMRNALAVEFDTWTNPEDKQDMFYDHVSIRSGGGEGMVINAGGESGGLGYPRAVDLADGKVHSVRIRYLPYLETSYLSKMTANEALLPYLKDNGEGRRLGTLAVYVDDLDGLPLLAIPLNLSVLLDLPQSLAYAGFTASTGRKWETHDVISWEWCDSEGCRGDEDKMTMFD